jgi:uncharacterized membrane protein YdjX (TVP38/TMEM64 family)
VPRPPSTPPPALLPERRVALLRLAALVVAVAVSFALVLLLVGNGEDDLREPVEDLGAWGAPVFVLLMAGLTCAFFPFPVMAAVSGIVFGTAGGTVVSILGGTLGATLAFLIARRFGAGPVEALAGERLRGLIDAVSRRGFVAVLYLRIFPGVPRDLANYLCGLTRIELASYVAATLLGISPRAYAYTALGGSLGDLGNTQSVVAVALLVAMALLGLWLVGRDVRRPGSGPGSSSPAGRSAGRR